MHQKFFLILSFSLILAIGCNSPSSRQEISGNDSLTLKLETLNKNLSDDPSNPDLYNARAACYLATHQYDKALQDVNKAISLNNRNTAYYITLSDIYLLMGQPQNSRDALLTAIRINSGDKDALLRLAKLYLIMKDYKNCYEMVRQALLIDNTLAPAYFTRAIGMLEQGDTNRAVTDLMQAVDKNQNYYEAYVQLGDLFAMKKDPLAEAYLKNALKLRPDSREALYMLGMFYQETAHYEKAIETYQTLIRTDPSFREAPYNIGYIYLVYLKDFAKAIPFFTASLERDPQFYQALFNRGYAYELSGDYKNAADDYQRSLKIKVNYDKAVEGLNRLDKKQIRK